MEAVASLVRLTSVELLKYWRRPIARVILILMFLGPIGAELILVSVSKEDAVFPNVAGVLFAGSNLLFIAMATVVVAVLSLGNDYELGTVRVFLGRGVGRPQFVISKIITTTSAALVNGLTYMAGALTSASIAHAAYSQVSLANATSGDLLWRSLAATLVVGLVGMISAAVVMLVLAIGKSSWLGMLAGLGLFLADYYLTEWVSASTDLYRYTISYHSLVLLENLFPSIQGLDPASTLAETPDPLRALVLLLLYGFGFTLAAIMVLQRQDLIAKN